MERVNILKILSEEVVNILPDVSPNIVTEDNSLQDIGANSIDRFDIISKTMSRCGVKIALTKFLECKNIADIITVIEKNESDEKDSRKSRKR